LPANQRLGARRDDSRSPVTILGEGD
jgi:hypothetical protein